MRYPASHHTTGYSPWIPMRTKAGAVSLSYCFYLCPQRDSNSCCRRERACSRLPRIQIDAFLSPATERRIDCVISCSNTSTCGDSMPLNIRNEQAEQLASALAKLTGETKTEAVTQALRERLDRVRRARAKRRLADELDAIALHCSARPVRDRHSADEILGYDENGLPR
jgi:antitoxin VapB